MWRPMLVAIVCTMLACLPVFVARRKVLLNPAFLVLLIVLWSPLLKTLYSAYSPPTVSPGQIAGAASVSDFLMAGVSMVLIAMCAYAGSFLLVGERTLRVRPWAARWRHASARHNRRAVIALTLLSVTCFILYLFSSGTEFFSLPFSAKRFAPRDTGVTSRFAYPPYYFFKVAMLSGSIAYTAAYLLFRSEDRRADRRYRLLFSIVFLFALMLSHFASLRLFIFLVLVQIGILTYYMSERRRIVFVGGFAALAAASFAIITFVHRAPPLPVETIADSVSERDTESWAWEGEPRAAEAPDRRGRVRGSNEGGRADATEALDRGLRRFGTGAFGGRYFLDVGKLAHIAHYFPAEHPYAMGEAFVGLPMGAVSDPEASAAVEPVTIDRYLASRVLGEPNNSVPPGFAGELYINFGWVGILVGFLLLGAFHRVLFNYLTRPDLPVAIGACLVLLIPNTTLVLLNSGLGPTVSRSLIDVAVFFLVCPFWLGSREARSVAPKTKPEHPAPT